MPNFRFNALEEQFVLKLTKVCEIFNNYGKLPPTFNIRQMLEILKTKDWRDIPPFEYYLTPLQLALDKVIAELLRMQKEGPLRSRYYIELNEELQNLVIEMVRLDGICQWLIGDELKQDQFKFIYNVHKTVYDCALKDFYLNSKNNTRIIETVVP